MDDIYKLPYLEAEIRTIVDGFTVRTCETEFFGAFNERECKGHCLAMEWFCQKGHDEFCKALPEIAEIIKKYWFEEFGEPLPDDLLSPYELLQTYVCCKAKNIVICLPSSATGAAGATGGSAS